MDEGSVVPSEEFALGSALSNDGASTEGLTVAVLAPNQASVLLARALGASWEFDGQRESLVLGLGFSLGSWDVLDSGDWHKRLASRIRRHFAFVRSGTVSIDLEERHSDGPIGGEGWDALGNGFLELGSLVERSLFLAVELLGATCRVIAFGVARGLVEEPEVLASEIGYSEADAFDTIGTLDFGDDAMGADGGNEEDSSEEASVEDHDVFLRGEIG